LARPSCSWGGVLLVAAWVASTSQSVFAHQRKPPIHEGPFWPASTADLKSQAVPVIVGDVRTDRRLQNSCSVSGIGGVLTDANLAAACPDTVVLDAGGRVVGITGELEVSQPLMTSTSCISLLFPPNR
jgi:hypothetical protein